jgi:hypothetical protein
VKNHRGFAGYEKNDLFCRFERSEESLFLSLGSNQGEIPRFAWNDKTAGHFFRNLFSRWPVLIRVVTRRQKRLLHETYDPLAKSRCVCGTGSGRHAVADLCPPSFLSR